MEYLFLNPLPAFNFFFDPTGLKIFWEIRKILDFCSSLKYAVDRVKKDFAFTSDFNP
jgi:hypothetical protein